MDISALDQELRTKTQLAVQYSKARWRERSGKQTKAPGASITFMGTGGNPEAVLGQRPKTAGFLVDIGDFFMWADPGPSALQGVQDKGIDTGTLDAIYISHGHVDHYGGAEILVEGMCWAMSTRRGYLLGPKRVFEDERLISDYHQGDSGKSGYAGGPEVVLLEGAKPVQIKDVTIIPHRAYHGSENYGFVLEYQGFRLGYTSDTNYIRTYRTSEGIRSVNDLGIIMDFEEIEEYRQDVKDAYQDVDVLIANVTTHNAWAHRHITTLGLPHLLQGCRAKLVILNHFNYCCLEPEDLRVPMANYVQVASGIPAIPAYDGLKVDLQQFLKEK